jgi:aspartate ammonia-lyase
MIPLMAKNILDSLKILKKGVSLFTEIGLVSIKANTDRCREWLEKSFSLATVIAPKIGYDTAAEMVGKAIEEKKSLKEILVDENIITEKDYEVILKDKHLIKPRP